MNTKHLQHLFLRAGFGIGYDELKSLTSKTKEKIVKELFLKTKRSTPLEIDLSELETLLKVNYNKSKGKMDAESMMDLKKKSRAKVKELNYAWLERLAYPSSVLNEKMTLFWANVFVCRDNNIWHIQQYNNTLRKHALGNFREFVKAIAKEPSMSKYLNNRQNIKESPNENFARELMELFTLGIGNYTENDIKESARAFTGWSFNKKGEYLLRKKKHDYGVKTFMGKTGDFDGETIIDIILDQKQSARFICTKIYRYFVNPIVDENHLEEITNFFYKDYDINELMQYIFNSSWFYDEDNIGVKIKSPIELLIGIQKTVPIEFEKKKQQLFLQKMMGQILLNPPNVAGWTGDRNWIDSNTLMFRLNLPSILLNSGVINLDEKGDYKDTYEKYYNRKKSKTKFFKINASWDDFENEYGNLSSEELKRLLIVSKIDFDTDAFLSNLKIESNKEYCIQLMSLPEYQLC